jgi:hypothetical protein
LAGKQVMQTAALSATWILGAFLVTGGLAGREGVVDLAQRALADPAPLVSGCPVHRPLGSNAHFIGYMAQVRADFTSLWLAVSTRGGGSVFVLQLFRLPKRSDSPELLTLGSSSVSALLR